LGRPGQGASQVEISPCPNCATQFLTVAYNGARFCQNGVNFLRRFALKGKKLDDSSHLHVVEIVRIAGHTSFQPL
jgi:hypothetical protein